MKLHDIAVGVLLTLPLSRVIQWKKIIIVFLKFSEIVIFGLIDDWRVCVFSKFISAP